MTAAERTNSLLTAPILPTLVRMSLPNLIAMLATALVAVAETAYVGRLGTPSLAGMALVFPMVMLQQQMSSGAMGGGISSAVARALGSGDAGRAARIARHAVVIGVVAGLMFTAVFLGLGSVIYRLLGGSGEAHAAALHYSNTAFLGSIGVWLANTLASIVRGTGNMRLPSLALLIAAGLQILLGGVLGLGLGPVPRLGMSGIALGQVLSFGGCALFLGWYLMAGRARVRLSLNGGLEWGLFADILKVGALACLSSLQSVLSVLVLARLLAQYGTEALAGYGIGARLEFLLVPITSAIGIACVPLVGMAIGAGDVARARRVAWTGGVLAAGVVGTIGGIVALQPEWWTRLFSQDSNVIAAARAYFAWAGPCYGLFGLGMCLYFASQGSGRVLGPVLAQTVRLVVIVMGGSGLLAIRAPQWTLFALVGLAMACYGLVAALSIHLARWGVAGEYPRTGIGLRGNPT